jgi:phenylalanyl-tRNA synthetase beta chain
MRLPIEWIKEHIRTEAGPEEIADRLTMAGLEVEEKAESAIGAVLDIKVTPNRGDCLSVKGVARELRAAYAITGGEVLESAGGSDHLHMIGDSHAPGAGAGSPHSPSASDLTSVTIEAPVACLRYAARLVRNLRTGPSPQWMQDRITAAGMRPINNIVDVTNYVMLETGQPLHAFDYDALAEHRIVVRRAWQGEKLTTLDGQERALTPNMLVIADGHKAVALAGVMGGGETEVTEQTTTMLLESAHFDPLAVRRTAKSLDMRTEASYRFERFVDPAGVVAAADRACELIAELGAGDVVPGVVDVIAGEMEARRLELRPARVSEMLGYDVSTDEIVTTLVSLGFLVASAGSGPLTVQIPSWRPDIVREIDLIEEVGRVLGYERIPETLPRGSTTQGAESLEWRFAERLRSILAGAGLQEIVSHSLLAESSLEDKRTGHLRVAIRSALSAELSGLRRSLLPGLVEAMERNARRGLSPLAFFEVGHLFLRENSSYTERPAVGAAIAGPLAPASWQKESRAVAADYYAIRGLIETLAEGLHIAGLSFSPSADPRLHPGRSADVLLHGSVIGHVGELHPDMTRELTVRQRVVVFELQVDALRTAVESGRDFHPPTPFPSVVRDLAPRLTADVAYRSVERSVEGVRVPFLENLAVTDLYTGAPLPEGIKSLTLSLTFRAFDRTLTEEEVSNALNDIRQALERDCGAVFVA